MADPISGKIKVSGPTTPNDQQEFSVNIRVRAIAAGPVSVDPAYEELVVYVAPNDASDAAQECLYLFTGVTATLPAAANTSYIAVDLKNARDNDDFVNTRGLITDYVVAFLAQGVHPDGGGGGDGPPPVKSYP